MSTWLPNESRAKQVKILLAMVALVQLVATMSSLMQLNLIQKVMSGEVISQAEILANDGREVLLVRVYALVMLISAVVFIRWFHRAYENLHNQVPYLVYPKNMAIWSWFIPILNLIRPFRIMKELVEESDLLASKRGITLPAPLSTGFVRVWWTLWILMGVVGSVSNRLYLRAESLELLKWATLSDLAFGAVLIPLCLVALKLVHDVSQAESALARSEQSLTSPT